ncbi:helix-turn-helix domain-containing protein [Achromobacter sp.]|jgi:DNA-binding IclR family transcriptional regulator|uniref:helix-turn-helix domain-containing protein n=1 Tax=Achromobacter sp. TaxID=134375 RepID=UPI003D04CB2E
MSAPALLAPAPLARAKAVIETLAGNNFDGLRNQQVANAIRASASTTLRTLEALEAVGWAERIPGKDERWRLSPRLIQLAIAHNAEVAREEQQLDDFRNRYSRIPT